MKKIVLIGLSSFIAINIVFAENLTPIPETKASIPFADPLAGDRVVLDSEIIKPLTSSAMELRPAAIIDTEDEKVEPVQIEELKEDSEINTDNTKEEPPIKTEEISDEKQTVENEKVEPINNEPESEEITEETNAVEEPVNESDAIELNVGKGALFIPNTDTNTIPVSKTETLKSEMYNIKPTKEVLDIRYDVDSTKVNSEFEPYIQYKKEETSTDLKYKLNPNLSIKNTYSKSVDIKASEPIMTIKSTDEEPIKNIKIDEKPTQFSAGEPTHNQIQPGKKIFRF